MSEWQPARFRTAHYELKPGDLSWEQLEKVERVINEKPIRIMPADPGEALIAKYRAAGCDGSTWFRLHPDDVQEYVDKFYACEHEILTD